MSKETGIRISRLSQAVREAELATERQRRLRDEEIDRAEAEGYSIRDIGRWADLAPASIQRILARVEAARQRT